MSKSVNPPNRPKLTPFFKHQPSDYWYLPSARAVMLSCVACLLVLSLLMVTSASIPFTLHHEALTQLHFFWRQLSYILVGMVAAYVVTFVPLKWVFNLTLEVFALLFVMVLLVMTLLTTPINGAKRWLDLGIINLQAAELAKLAIIVFTANFVVRRSSEVRESWGGVVRLFLISGTMFAIILAQPDFGSVVIITGCMLAIFYVAGAPIGLYIGMIIMTVFLFATAIYFSDYRSIRAMSFLDPFDDLSGSDYQLSRSLIAFGRGEWHGVGYGNSIQKLSYLPEAHTDFVLAITGEELGFFGVGLVLMLQATLVASMMRISITALKRNQMRISYMAFGFAIMFVGQTVVNAGMNMGLMPTKGLTMPFFSFGGTSMVVCLIIIGMIYRMSKESDIIKVDDCRNY
ncbi:putative lipid II flippase FtsW [Moraxella lincolnii]|uniref:putative lipid II flippase FtsW n=1 Tax=Lwoffella lincolnii TaxID=90241 RepID=UPI00197CA74B|nr:putative lipid II flippase FtsW [Moraxella lincolnii]